MTCTQRQMPPCPPLAIERVGFGEQNTEADSDSVSCLRDAPEVVRLGVRRTGRMVEVMRSVRPGRPFRGRARTDACMSSTSGRWKGPTSWMDRRGRHDGTPMPPYVPHGDWCPIDRWAKWL